MEKRDLMPEMFSDVDLDQQMRVKCAFDPDHLLNPGKVFPQLRRCAELPQALRGTAEARRGVLAKAPKPIQERRIDLPVIGPATVERAAAAGLAGVVGEARGILVVDRPGVIAAADRLGLFVLGVAPP